MSKASLCVYSVPYILAKRNITVTNTPTTGAAISNANKKVSIKQ